jgi:hypothetical protein
MIFNQIKFENDWDNIKVFSNTFQHSRVFWVLVEYKGDTYRVSYNIDRDRYPLMFPCNSQGEITDYLEVDISDHMVFDFLDQFHELISDGDYE